jgi:hypothetical protein
VYDAVDKSGVVTAKSKDEPTRRKLIRPYVDLASGADAHRRVPLPEKIR